MHCYVGNSFCFYLDITTLKDNLQSITNENTNLLTTIEKQNTELTILKSKEEDFVQRLDHIQNESDKKQTEVEQLLHESSQFVIDKETVLNELSSIKTERDNFREQYGTLQCEMDNNSLKISDLESSISQLKHQLGAKDDVLVEKVQYISNMLAKERQKDAEIVEKDEEICDLKMKLETTGAQNTGSTFLYFFWIRV